ncbi:putative clathrin assembly protein At5g57200 [Arabidopsis lyrata subsp. lyrata]|uniref:putative clathrin assembly protein At5g57200 n=1 Tax=Arabidopsis lyrata subsp. lyrata TaxID=81972 RepID=UPI000A29A8EA|nr:putative clathrin assembly protein At5g57200 [Arabidopsis lyrata subsp. lyrata]|eukprot:XP_020872767.1 putative clathrin assembly protein At5g57200 [Arabidopsis lyrata subsp. lyrata]
MGTFTSFRKAYGALKDTTTVGLAKVNSEFKDLDIAIVKATNHVESPPKERHVRKIFSATSVIQPRADVAYCIHALSKRLSKTRNWVVAMKVLIVIHRTLREGDPTFREELLNYSHRRHILRISNFKDDTSPLAWDCSAWVRTYALFLEERLECYRVLKYDIEAERLPKASGAASKTHRTRMLSGEDLLGQLPALQQLLYRLLGCQPGGFDNLLLDSLYEDDTARRQIQLTNAGYGFGATAIPGEPALSNPNPFGMQQDPFAMSNNMAPPTNVQMAMQQQQMMMMNNRSPYNNNYSPYHHHQFSPNPSTSSPNPFGDPFLALPAPPSSATQQQHSHNHMLL